MLTGIYKKYFLLQLRIASWFCSIPFEWDGNVGKLRETKSNLRKTAWFSFVIIQWIYTPFLILRLIQPMIIKSAEVRSINDQFMLLGWIAVFTGSSLYHIPMMFNRTTVLRLTNSMIDFEEENFGNPKRKYKKTIEDKIDDMVLLGSCICSVAMPNTMAMVFWARPCSPQFIGSFFLDCSDENPAAVEKLAFLIFEIFLLHPFAGTIFFSAWMLKYAQLKCLVKYLRPVAWKSSFNLPASRIVQHFKQRITRYNQIKILVSFYNDCFLITTQGIQAVACAATIAPLYVTIRMYGVIKMPGYLFFPMTAIQASSVIYFLFGAAGNVFKTSNMTIRRLNYHFQMRDNFASKRTKDDKWLSKNLGSLAPMKIRSGGLCFVDEHTVIVLLRFCLDQTVSLILIKDGGRH